MKRCNFEGCRNLAVFGSERCWLHTEDKESYRERLLSEIKKGTSLEGANLTKVDLAGLDLSRVNLSGANLSRANLEGATFFDAVIENAELLGAILVGTDLTSVNLEGSDLTRCDMQGARLWHANLTNTNLIEANLDRCDFWNAKLFNARFWRTNLGGALSISRKSFRHKRNRFLTIYNINEKGILSAEEAYRTLKKYFLINGRYDDASWASFKEKTMEKLLLKKAKNIAYLPSVIMDFLCGYGEKPHRIIISSFFVIVVFALLYASMNAIVYSSASGYQMSIGDYIYYSVITFTTVGYGDFIPKSKLIFRGLAASEAFIGTFMIGLFIFTLARKYSAR